MKEQLEIYKTYLLNIKRSLVYYNYLVPFFEYLQEKNLIFETLTKEQLAQYFSDKSYSPNSINNVIKTCRDYSKFLKLEKHSAFEIRLLEIEQRLPRYITYEELLKGIKYYSTYNVRGMSTVKCNAILKFLFFTGIRKGELLGLRREKIDLVNCSVAIWGKKDKTERTVYFPDKIIKDLTDYFNSEPEEINNAFSITLSEINYLSKKIGKYLNKNISTHIFRHSSATYMMKNNVSPLVMQRILGHSSLQTTLIYANPDDKMAQEIYKKQIG
jgi:site-specific recombinase XerD